MEQPKNDVLRVKRLHVEFQTSHGMVHAVKDVSLEVKRGRSMLWWEKVEAASQLHL